MAQDWSEDLFGYLSHYPSDLPRSPLSPTFLELSTEEHNSLRYNNSPNIQSTRHSASDFSGLQHYPNTSSADPLPLKPPNSVHPSSPPLSNIPSSVPRPPQPYLTSATGFPNTSSTPSTPIPTRTTPMGAKNSSFPLNLTKHHSNEEYIQVCKKHPRYLEQYCVEGHPTWDEDKMKSVRVTGEIYFIRKHPGVHIQKQPKGVIPKKYKMRSRTNNSTERIFDWPDKQLRCKLVKIQVKDSVTTKKSKWRLYHFTKSPKSKSPHQSQQSTNQSPSSGATAA